MSDQIIPISCHLIVGAKLVPLRSGSNIMRLTKTPSIRVSKGKPSTGADEVAIKLNIELPMALFVKPSLEAKIAVPAEKHPFVITPDVQENIAQVIREQTGFTVNIQTAAPDAE